jgi:hypothetical protein
LVLRRDHPPERAGFIALLALILCIVFVAIGRLEIGRVAARAES